MRRTCLFLVLAAMLALAFPPERAQAAQRVTLTVGGASRYYDLYVPPGRSGYPLVMLFHGGLTSPDFIRRDSGYEQLAQREGFAIAFMAGTAGMLGPDRLVWNAGGCCASAMRQGVDDVAYVRAALRQITSNYPVDTRRVYLVGTSNGGMLVQRLATVMSGQVAAAASIGGPRFGPVPAGAPVPMLLIHAVGDPQAPFNGGYSTNSIIRRASSQPFLPVPEGARSWAARNRCTSSSTKQFPGYQVTEYEGCAGGASVRLIALNSQEHVWFGGGRSPGAAVNATSATWSFLRNFSR